MTRTEEIDCGGFFDQFDDLIDFPTDPTNGLLNFNDFSTENEIDPIFPGDPIRTDAAGGVSYLSVPVPYEDMLQLEWLSNFFENSSVVEEEDNMIKTESPHNHHPFSLSSPISVLESSSTATTATTVTTTTSSSSCSGGGGKTKRGPRSKRPRPATFTPRSDNFAESRILVPGEEPEKKKIKKIKKPACSSSNQLRKCMHCEITKTPQWRMGPMGPKTLCNACGVRHKSGRLFPEYRPAASPTFVPTLHSNSHKKVMEMREV